MARKYRSVSSRAANLNPAPHEVLFRQVLREQHQVWEVVVVAEDVQQEAMAFPAKVFDVLNLAAPDQKRV